MAKEKPKVKLTGTDGNVFALAGKVSATLKRAGLTEQAKEFNVKLSSCKSYGEALTLMREYVDVR